MLKISCGVYFDIKSHITVFEHIFVDNLVTNSKILCEINSTQNEAYYQHLSLFPVQYMDCVHGISKMVPFFPYIQTYTAQSHYKTVRQYTPKYSQ